MTGTVTISAGAYYTGSNKVVVVESGIITVSGDSDTVISGASSVGINLRASNSLISVTGSNDSITAGVPIYGVSGSDSLFVGGNYNTIADFGFNGGGITLNGSYNKVTSNQKSETADILINGLNNAFYNLYLSGNVTVNGNNELIEVGSVNVIVNGNNDTVISVLAKSINDAGNNNVFMNEAVPGQTVPYNIIGGSGSNGNNTTPGAAITVTGSGASITTLTNNNTVVSSGSQNNIAALSYNNSISVTGAQSAVSTETTDEQITMAGGNSTLSTSTANGLPVNSSVPASTFTIVGNGTVGAVYNDASPNIDLQTSSFPVTINVTTTNTNIVANANQTINDSVGGNHFSISGASIVNILGRDAVQVADGSNLSQDSIAGSVINFGSHDLYYGVVNKFVNSNNTLNVNGSGNTGIIYTANQDTLNENGTGNLFLLEASGGTVTGGSAINVSGNNEFIAFTDNNTVNGANGARLVLQSDYSFVTGSNVNVQILGTGNNVNLTGSDTVSGSNPYAYQTTFDPSQTAQSNFTVQSGAVTLGGLDTLLQTQGTAQINLFGGNNVTLYGGNDTVTANDQIYGGNLIVNNGSNNQIALEETNLCADTIMANAGTAVTLTDIQGMHIGGNSGNAVERLIFISAAGTSNTILGSASNAAVTMSGGSSTANIVYGGFGGSNSLNGGTGARDLFVAGGNNDILIGGSGGNDTLVSAAGNETFFTAAIGTDLISIIGGGGVDFIQGFKGSLQLSNGLSVQSESTVGGSVNMVLNDGTHLIFSGVSSLTQNGNLFTH